MIKCWLLIAIIYKGIFNNLINQAMKQATLVFSFFVMLVRVDVTLYIQILIKLTTVTTANALQSHFTLVKKMSKHKK